MEPARARADDGVAGGVLADEEQRGGDDIDRVEQLEGFLGEEVLGHPRARDGAQRVDLDVVFRALELERLCQACEAELGRAVIGLAEIAEQPGRARRHQHAAIGLLAEGFPAGLGGIGRTIEVNVDDEGEILCAHLGKGLVAQHTGIVDQHMDAAPLLLGVGNHLIHLLGIGDRGTIGHRGAAGLFDFLDDLRGHVGSAGAIARSAQIVDHDLGAAPSELERVFAAQAAACAGDDGYLVLEIDGHAGSPIGFT